MVMDQFLLFGDSLTQCMFSRQRGFAVGAALADQYVRRLQVVNAGCNGYNTRQALEVIDKVIPPASITRLRFLTIWFGANDARLPNTPGVPQHVPLDEYTANMRKIITHPTIQAHKDVRIIVLTPPPVEETLQANLDKLHGEDSAGLRRTALATAAYAQAARDVAAELNVRCLDIWTAIMSRAGYTGDPTVKLPGTQDLGIDLTLTDMLYDGLHLDDAGYRIVYAALMILIAEIWPDQLPDKLEYVLPAWDHPTAWKSR